MKQKRFGLLVFSLAIGLMSTLGVAMSGCTSSSTSLSSIVVSPPYPSGLVVGGTQQFVASGVYANGSNSDITSQVTWASSNASVATISSRGLANYVGAGLTGITASMNGVISTAIQLQIVAAPTLTSISISTTAPPNQPAGSTQQWSAIGAYSDGSRQDITSQVTWLSSNTAVATISSGGLLIVVSVGNTTIAASLGGIVSPAAVDQC